MGRRIVEGEQSAAVRAGYGEHLLERLSEDLTKRFGRGFSIRNLRSFRAFYLEWPIRQISSAESLIVKAGEKSRNSGHRILQLPIGQFALPWSHYVGLLSVENRSARQFYVTEALRGGWTVKQLDRQVSTQFYERTASSQRSKNVAVMPQLPQSYGGAWQILRGLPRCVK